MADQATTPNDPNAAPGGGSTAPGYGDQGPAGNGGNPDPGSETFDNAFGTEGGTGAPEVEEEIDKKLGDFA